MAVGINDNNNVRWVGSQMRQSTIQRISFARRRRINSFDRLSAGGLCNGFCIVHAIVGNNEKAIAGKQLLLDVVQSWSKAVPFVVGWNEYRDALAHLTSRDRNGISPPQKPRGNLNKEDKNRNGHQAGERRQEI